MSCLKCIVRLMLFMTKGIAYFGWAGWLYVFPYYGPMWAMRLISVWLLFVGVALIIAYFEERRQK